MISAMIPVTSSQIASMGHDPVNSTMRVVFKTTGKAYNYTNVNKATFDGLMAAESVGSAFSKTIKANPLVYPCTPE